jgi:LemA protein
MRHFFRISVLLILLSQSCFGQDTTALINASWTNLKTQLQRRTDIITNLTNELYKSTNVDKVELTNSKTYCIDLFKYVDTLTFRDSLSISLAYNKNNRLTQAISRTLVTLENDQNFKNRNEVTILIMHLEGCENRLALVKREYNETCKVYQRTDLYFGNNQVDKAPEVKF